MSPVEKHALRSIDGLRHAICDSVCELQKRVRKFRVARAAPLVGFSFLLLRTMGCQGSKAVEMHSEEAQAQCSSRQPMHTFTTPGSDLGDDQESFVRILQLSLGSKEQERVLKSLLLVICTAFSAEAAVLHVLGDDKVMTIVNYSGASGSTSGGGSNSFATAIDKLSNSGVCVLKRSQFLMEQMLEDEEEEFVLLSHSEVTSAERPLWRDTWKSIGPVEFQASVPVRITVQSFRFSRPVATLSVLDSHARQVFGADCLRNLTLFADLCGLQLSNCVQVEQEAAKERAAAAASMAVGKQSARLGQETDPFKDRTWLIQDAATTAADLSHLPWALAWNEAFPRPPIPADDRSRILCVLEYDLLNFHQEPLFDEFCKFTAELFGFPLSVISVLTADAQFFKGRFGLQLSKIDRSAALCNYPTKKKTSFVVQDLAQHKEFQENPLVNGGAMALRFYAGVPLIVESGHAVGTLCLLDCQAHPEFGNEETRLLEGIAAVLTHLLEERRKRLRYMATMLDLPHCGNGHERYTTDPPQGYATFVAAEIANAERLWSVDPRGMESAVRSYSSVLRATLSLYRGYEVSCQDESFLIAFHNAVDACSFCTAVQLRMLQEKCSDEWPAHVSDPRIPGADGHGLCYGGILVNFGLEQGALEFQSMNPASERRRYFCQAALRATEICRSIIMQGVAVMTSLVWHDYYRCRFHSVAHTPADTMFPTIVHLGEFLEDENTGQLQNLFMMVPAELTCKSFRGRPDHPCSFVELCSYGRPLHNDVLRLQKIACGCLDSPKGSSAAVVRATVWRWRQMLAECCSTEVVASTSDMICSVFVSQARAHKGYIFNHEHTNAVDLVFPSIHKAVHWVFAVQNVLVNASWSSQLLNIPGYEEVKDSNGDFVLFRGPRIQVSASDLWTKDSVLVPDLDTGRLKASGTIMQEVARLSKLAQPGQFLCCRATGVRAVESFNYFRSSNVKQRIFNQNRHTTSDDADTEDDEPAEEEDDEETDRFDDDEYVIRNVSFEPDCSVVGSIVEVAPTNGALSYRRFPAVLPATPESSCLQ
eukprot:ANDGO_02163.mRNA.1 Adenylate cyclase